LKEKGIGEYQVRKARESREAILTILNDNKPHRYTEIVEKTKLSTATVSKVLKKLDEEKKIEKNIDTESGEYPYPVYYRLCPEGARALIVSKQIGFMDDSFVETKWPKDWIKEGLREIVTEAYKKKFGAVARLKRSKESRFFYEILKKEVIEQRASETTLTVFHKGLQPFAINQDKVKVTIELLLDLFADIVDARKNDEEPVMMVLSYLPTALEEEQAADRFLEIFVNWAKQFKGVDLNTVPQENRKELQEEYLTTYKKYYDSLSGKNSARAAY